MYYLPGSLHFVTVEVTNLKWCKHQWEKPVHTYNDGLFVLIVPGRQVAVAVSAPQTQIYTVVKRFLSRKFKMLQHDSSLMDEAISRITKRCKIFHSFRRDLPVVSEPWVLSEFPFIMIIIILIVVFVVVVWQVSHDKCSWVLAWKNIEGHRGKIWSEKVSDKSSLDKCVLLTIICLFFFLWLSGHSGTWCLNYFLCKQMHTHTQGKRARGTFIHLILAARLRLPRLRYFSSTSR